MTEVKPSQEKVTIGDSTSVTADGHGTACLTTSEGQDLQLDDFFDKFGGGSTKTEDKDAALMANEKK